MVIKCTMLYLLLHIMCVGLKPPPAYTPSTGLPTSTPAATSTVSGLTGLTGLMGKQPATTIATPSIGAGLGLPKPTVAAAVKPGLTGLTATTGPSTTSLTSSASSGVGGGSGAGKTYTYKELENLVNKVRREGGRGRGGVWS